MTILDEMPDIPPIKSSMIVGHATVDRGPGARGVAGMVTDSGVLTYNASSERNGDPRTCLRLSRSPNEDVEQSQIGQPCHVADALLGGWIVVFVPGQGVAQSLDGTG